MTRSSNKINEALGQSLLSSGKIPPGSTEGTNIARIVVNEIDAARFDPLLEKAVAKNATTCLDSILSKLDGMVRLRRILISGNLIRCSLVDHSR